MAHVTNPVLVELDDIAHELEKTGNADLAVLVDECAAEIVSAPKRTAVAKKPVAKKPVAKKVVKKAPVKGKKPARKSAEVSHSSRRASVAQAMRRIAKAQVTELEDIASALLRDGDKRAALDVLKIAEDLDSSYAYSDDSHEKPKAKGTAADLFDSAKANKPDMKGDAEDKEDLENPFAEGKGYPFNEKRSAFDKKLDELLKIAMDGEDMPEGLDLGGDEPESEDEESEEPDGDEPESEDEEAEESEDEESEDAELPEVAGDDADEGDDELAALMKAIGADEGEDAEASSARMAKDEEIADEDGEDELDLGDLGDEAEDEDSEEPDGDEEDDLGDLGDEEDSEEPDGDEDVDAGIGGAVAGGIAGGLVGGPAGALGGAAAGSSLQNTLSASTSAKKVAALAKHLQAKGQTKLAKRVASLLRSK